MPHPTIHAVCLASSGRALSGTCSGPAAFVNNRKKTSLHESILSGIKARFGALARYAAALDEKQLLDKLWETYELSHEAARAQRVELESVPKAQRRVGELKKAISGLGNINLDAIEEFQRVNERYTYLTDQRDDVLKSKKELEGIIADITEEMKTIFARQFSVINEAFQQTFTELFGGGKATLELEEPEDILNCGIEIRVQPPGKALKVLSLLSGGEKVRCMLSRMMLFGSNALVLDQPTNHLDLESITALNNGLTDFSGIKGVVLFASHDHEFVQTIANRVMEFVDGKLIDKMCTYDAYIAGAREEMLARLNG